MAAHRSPIALQHLRKPEKSQFPSTFTTLHLVSAPWTSPHLTAMSSSASPTLEGDPPTTASTPLPILELISYDSSTPWGLKSSSSSSPATEELGEIEKVRDGAFFSSLLVRVVKLRMDLVLDDLRRFSVFPDSIACARLVSACIRARKFRAVDSILEAAFGFTGEEVASSALEAAMRGYNKLHMYSSSVAAYQLLLKMRDKSVNLPADPASYLMEAYMKLGKFSKVLEVFSELDSSGKIQSTRVYEVLIESLCRSDSGYLKALAYFREMSPRSPSIYSSLISSLASAGQVEAAEELVEQGRGSGMLKDPALFFKLVIMYVRQGLVERSLEVVDTMVGANMRVSDCVFSGIVNGFAKQRGLRSAVEVYEGLVSRGIVPGQVSLASVLNVYFRMGLYREAEAVFEEMEKRGFDRCVVAYSTMIVMYGKTGRASEAMKMVGRMKSKGCNPNVWVYNSLIELHGRAKNVRQVEKVWKEMKRRRVAADRVSYTSLINAYSKARQYDKCVDTYEEFRLNGGVADRAMAGTMVGVLSKLGRVDHLIALLQDMKAEGTNLDDRLSRSALNALKDAGVRLHLSWFQDTFQSMTPAADNLKPSTTTS